MKYVVVFVAVMSLFCANAYAGIEPSPFTPEINQLGAVSNGLNSCLDRVNKVLSSPPDDVIPSPNVNGAVNRLEAITGQMNSLNDFIANTILSVTWKYEKRH